MLRRGSSQAYKVLGSEPSPYTNKVYSYMRYKGIPFENVLATAQIYQNLIVKKVGWPVVPVLVTPEDEWIQDSEDIILHLEKKFPEHSIIPQGKKQQLAAELLQYYGDQHLQQVSYCAFISEIA